MYTEHRRRLMARLAREGAAAVIPTARHKLRNHDCEYRFRPDSDFWYLTGFAEPQATLVLLPERGGDGSGESLLFLRDRDPAQETWTGRRLGVEAAPELLGVDGARPIESLMKDLPELLQGYERLVYRTGVDEARDRDLLEVINTLRGKARGGVRPPVELVDHVATIHELRLHKSEAELALMRRAAEVTTEAHLAAMAAATPGGNECEVDAIVEYTFRRRGSTGPAYTNIVAGGANATILHYVQNDAELVDGELLLLDAGAEWDYYASDVTRTFPVNGRFSEAQRALYEVVLRAQRAAVDHVRPGVRFVSIHEVALAELVDGLLELGLLSGSREEAIEKETYKPFFMHRTGHWLGLDVHDCGYYSVDGGSRILEPGMTLTVEPGLYVDPGNGDVEQRWHGIGVRIEDDVLVTEEGRQVLTEAIPKSLEDVQAACTGASLAGVG